MIGAGSAGVAAAEGIVAGAVPEQTTGRAPARLHAVRLVVVDDAPPGHAGWSGRLAVAALHEAAAGRLTWAEAADRVRQVRRGIVARHESRLLALQADAGPGAVMISGRARFGGAGTVLVEPRGVDGRGGTQRVVARRVVLATGCVPVMPEVTGLLETRFLTGPEVATVLEDDRPPVTAAVLGAGSTGCALAQALARLGVTVTLIDQHETVLSGEDTDAAALVSAALRRDGVRLLLGSPVVKVAPTLDGGAWLATAAGVDVAAERLLLAAGWRAASGGLDLPSVGVEVTSDGAVTVDSALVTSAPAVLAAGGVVAGEPHAAAALAMGAVAGANALSRRPAATWSAAAVATLTLTDPEVAGVGLTDPDQIRAQQAAGVALSTGTVHWSEGERAVQSGVLGMPGVLGMQGVSGVGEGFVRVVVGRARPGCGRWIARRTASGAVRVLGATVVGCRAGDLVAPLALAIGSGLPASALASAVSADPTWSGALRLAVSRACTDLRTSS